MRVYKHERGAVTAASSSTPSRIFQNSAPRSSVARQAVVQKDGEGGRKGLPLAGDIQGCKHLRPSALDVVVRAERSDRVQAA